MAEDPYRGDYYALRTDWERQRIEAERLRAKVDELTETNEELGGETEKWRKAYKMRYAALLKLRGWLVSLFWGAAIVGALGFGGLSIWGLVVARDAPKDYVRAQAEKQWKNDHVIVRSVGADGYRYVVTLEPTESAYLSRQQVDALKRQRADTYRWPFSFFARPWW